MLTELRRPGGHPGVRSAVAEIPDSALFISALTVGEIAKGIALLAAGRKKKALTSWLNGLETLFGDRILGIDAETGRVWGELTARAQKAGKVVLAADGLVAATALRHGFHLMTRNVRDFEPSGALLLNPWKDS